MTALRLTNTLTRRVEPFEPLVAGRVGVYLCGPTVYDLAHLGNARSAVNFDVLHRLLRHDYGVGVSGYLQQSLNQNQVILFPAISKLHYLSGQASQSSRDHRLLWLQFD